MKSGRIIGRFLCVCVMISTLTSSSLFCQSSSSFDSLSKVLVTVREPGQRVETLIALSREVIGQNPSDGIRYARDAYETAVKHHLTRETILSLIQLGISYSRISDYQRAIESAEKAIEMADDHNLPTETARAKKVMALIYYELGDYEKSANYDFENLSYYEKINDKKEIGIALGNIGIDFASQDNYTKALEYFKKSFDIAVKNNDYHGMAYQYNNMAGVYAEYHNDHRIALGYYKEALKINRKLDDKQQHAIYLMNLGNCFSKLNEHDSVLTYYLPACEIFKNLNNLYLTSECQTLIGEHYLRNGNLNISLKYADSAFDASFSNDFKEKIKSAAGLLERIYLARKDTINAYKYSKIENEAKDSLLILQNQKEVYKLEFQYNYEKIDKARKIANQKKESFLLVLIIALISGLIIILLAFSRHRIKSRNVALEKQSIENELNFKNKELTINLISLIKMNELLSGISKRMADIGKSAKRDETREAIDILSRELRNSTDNKMLKEFSMRFQEVHKGFYETLLQKYPDLSQNELRLCAFLRLNMTTKEIAELTGQRLLTIDHARYRLRKKLGISNSEVNLSIYLSQI